jgi:hypothetical protein
VRCGHRLVYETLDSIDEVWRSQDQKVELSCFYPKLLSMEVPLAPSCQVLSFSYLPFLDDIYFLCQSHFPDAPQIFHMLMEIRILLSALTLSFNSLTQAGECPFRAGEEAGGKLKDIR